MVMEEKGERRREAIRGIGMGRGGNSSVPSTQITSQHRQQQKGKQAAATTAPPQPHRTIAFFLAILRVPSARHVVMTAGRPSGIAATASATAILK